MMRTFYRQTGFSLLELLVALLIFSFGVLAVAGLQTVSKQANYESMQRTTASQIATGVLEDLRTNGNGIAAYLTAGGGIGGGSIAVEPAPNCSAGAECTPEQKALHDLWFWEQILDGNLETAAGAGAGGLLMPTMCVTGPAAGVSGIYIVTIVWRGSASLALQSANLCGAASGNYGAANELRRIVQIPTFIDPNF